MQAVEPGTEPGRSATRAVSPLGAIVLARIACDGGAGRAAIVRDLTPLVSHKLSPGEWRAAAAAELETLEAHALIASTRGRLVATASGKAAAEKFLGGHGVDGAWSDMRDIALVARSLGLEGESAQQLKALTRPEGLRALIVQKAFGLPLKGKQSASQLRAALAIVALERAFGSKLKASLGAGLSGKMGRALAGQLAERPQEFSSDGRLVAQLAAERAGSLQLDEDALRLALLRRLVADALRSARPAPAEAAVASASQRMLPPAAANDTRPLSAPPAPPKAVRPDLPTFAAQVHDAAKARAEGWPGNRKAYISHVWQAIRSSRPEWSLTEIEFKVLLAEAHRAGRIVLANADLKDKNRIKELQDSAIQYKNVVWHFVRVEG